MGTLPVKRRALDGETMKLVPKGLLRNPDLAAAQLECTSSPSLQTPFGYAVGDGRTDDGTRQTDRMTILVRAAKAAGLTRGEQLRRLSATLATARRAVSLARAARDRAVL